MITQVVVLWVTVKKRRWKSSERVSVKKPLTVLECWVIPEHGGVICLTIHRYVYVIFPLWRKPNRGFCIHQPFSIYMGEICIGFGKTNLLLLNYTSVFKFGKVSVYQSTMLFHYPISYIFPATLQSCKMQHNIQPNNIISSTFEETQPQIKFTFIVLSPTPCIWCWCCSACCPLSSVLQSLGSQLFTFNGRYIHYRCQESCGIPQVHNFPDQMVQHFTHSFAYITIANWLYCVQWYETFCSRLLVTYVPC